MKIFKLGACAEGKLINKIKNGMKMKAKQIIEDIDFFSSSRVFSLLFRFLLILLRP